MTDSIEIRSTGEVIANHFEVGRIDFSVCSMSAPVGAWFRDDEVPELKSQIEVLEDEIHKLGAKLFRALDETEGDDGELRRRVRKIWEAL